jgi:hypothetical protein
MWSYLCESRIASRFPFWDDNDDVWKMERVPPLWQATYLGNAATSCMAVAMTDLVCQGSQVPSYTISWQHSRRCFLPGTLVSGGSPLQLHFHYQSPTVSSKSPLRGSEDDL